MAGEVIVDALPYIDQGYDEPGIREAVSIFKNDNHFYFEKIMIGFIY